MNAVRTTTLLALMLALVFGLSPTAGAEDLKDARDKVRKALVQAKKDVSSDTKAVRTAADRLKDSEADLARARSELAYVQDKLATAKEKDAAVAADLAAAQAAFDTAAAAVVSAQADVERQRALVAVAVRTAYQQHTDLQGMTVVLGTDSASELADRVQWANTIFDTSTARLDRLNQLQAQLETARTARADAEATLTDRKRASAAQVADVKELTAQAASRKAELADLVVANRKLKAKASDELEASRSEYRKLEKQEARITAKLRGDSYNTVNSGGFIKPVNAPAGSGFGMRFHPILHYWRMHWGTDFGAACGAPIRAMANGKVVSAGWTTYGFGNFTLISYGRMKGAQLVSGYAHQSKIIVKAGEHVKQGQVVGYVGTTGLSTGCHLHLQIYRNGVRVNPMNYL
ncbi:peptidoglycan DD-metalloendopeptidase family protein [Propionicimonas sp.]|uniref:peptidoglycan DD-metalloendopeptidase family protein n=1 Tax=Propionicimonas sp. TaxID=1955623 RepID=UPI0039E7091C